MQTVCAAIQCRPLTSELSGLRRFLAKVRSNDGLGGTGQLRRKDKAMFDEEPDGDPHGECAEEIARLKLANIKVVAEAEQLQIDVERLQTNYNRLRMDACACAATLNKVRDDLRAANAACRNYEANYGILLDAIYGALAQLDDQDGLFVELHEAVSKTNKCIEAGCPQFGKPKANTCGCQVKQ